MEFELEHSPHPQTSWKGEMPCIVIEPGSTDASRLRTITIGDDVRLPADLRDVRDGLQRSGLLVPLGWREWVATQEPVPTPIASDDWEEDDDVVDDDDDEDEDEEEDDDDEFFPDDADEFDDEDDDDDDEDEDE